MTAQLKMADIDQYCRVYDGFLSPSDCEEYIEKYEETLRVDNNICDRLHPMKFNRFNELNERLMKSWQEAVIKYTKDCKIGDITHYQWPKECEWEELTIKRFKVNEKENNELKDHVDVYSHAHAKRFLCLMVYLNDDFEDGETYFPVFESKVKPKQGRLFIFPPTWNYLHRGIPPRSPSTKGAKYFIMTHLNYTDLSNVNSGTDFNKNKVAVYDYNTDKMTKEQLL